MSTNNVLWVFRDRRTRVPTKISVGVVMTPEEAPTTTLTWASTTTDFSSTTVTFADTEE
jgi:hypothetical protein